MRIFDIFEQFHKDAHEGRIDQAIGNVWIEDDRFKVDEHVKLVIYSATCSHFIVNLMKVLLKLCGLYLGRYLLSRPWLKWQRARCVFKCPMSLNVFIPNNRLYGSIWIVNQKLVNCLERHLVLVLIIVGFKTKDGLFGSSRCCSCCSRVYFVLFVVLGRLISTLLSISRLFGLLCTSYKRFITQIGSFISSFGNCAF